MRDRRLYYGYIVALVRAERRPCGSPHLLENLIYCQTCRILKCGCAPVLPPFIVPLRGRKERARDRAFQPIGRLFWQASRLDQRHLGEIEIKFQKPLTSSEPYGNISHGTKVPMLSQPHRHLYGPSIQRSGIFLALPPDRFGVAESS